MTLPKINLSINPSYHCNFRCNWCYLTPEQLGDTKTIDHIRLNDMLSEVMTHREINHIDLYGGEIGILKKDKLEAITNTIKFYYKDKININTNLSVIRDEFLQPDYYISVSWDFHSRQDHIKVKENIKKLPVPFSLIVLLTPTILKDIPAGNFIQMMKEFKFANPLMQSFELKPYSSNQANDHKITDAQFEDYLLDLFHQYKNHFSIDHSPEGHCKRVTFVNEENVLRSLAKDYNAFSDDHLYITPNGKFAVLDFDKDNREYFKELNSFEEYLQWTEKEKKENISNICRKCEYYGGCLTEHYRYVENLDNGCNGYKYVLDTYRMRYGKNKILDLRYG